MLFNKINKKKPMASTYKLFPSSILKQWEQWATLFSGWRTAAYGFSIMSTSPALICSFALNKQNIYLDA